MGISKAFTTPTYDEKRIAKGVLDLEGTPEAIRYFGENGHRLGDYSYWFLLSTLWVSYTGYSELELWKDLFGSKRAKRKQSIMKPSELKEFERFPYFVTVYRAHRPGEDDWIAYTLDLAIASRFAVERGVSSIREYKVKRTDLLALFLRRGEQEVLVLDKGIVRFVKEIDVVVTG